MFSNYQGITLHSLLINAYAMVLEKRLEMIMEPWIEVEQCGTVDQLCTLSGLLERSCVYWTGRRFTMISLSEKTTEPDQLELLED